MAEKPRLSKSEYKVFLDAPLHLWAYAHDRIEKIIDPLKILMGRQGYTVEKYAKTYLETEILPRDLGVELWWQKLFTDDLVTIRADALLHRKETNSCDLIEVKSATNIDKEKIIDAAFQFIFLSKHISIEHVFILHLDKNYIRSGDLDVSQLFIMEDVTENVIEFQAKIEGDVPSALAVLQADSPDGLTHCYKPGVCPCPSLCHPILPQESIYSIPGLREKKKKLLLDMGVLQIKEIPDDFPLSDSQREVVEVTRSGKPLIDRYAIKKEFEKFKLPYYFLDYESCISALPLFDGYHPQQQVVFQYSLHRQDQPAGELVHSAFVDTEDRDPSAALLAHLRQHIGDQGTIFVWNKTFEKMCNQKMALLRPEYKDFLVSVNSRIYDLADIVRKHWYYHPGFQGKWSLKSVLPVMVPELSYQTLDIHNGGMASTAWWRITQNGDDSQEIESTRQALLNYCEIDTLAMVRILEKLSDLI